MINLDDDELELSLDSLIPGPSKDKPVKKLLVITEELNNWLTEQGEKGISQSYIVRQALKEYKERHEKD